MKKGFLESRIPSLTSIATNILKIASGNDVTVEIQLTRLLQASSKTQICKLGLGGCCER